MGDIAVPAGYLDFDMLIDREGSSYRVRVLDSPGGQASSTVDLPFSPMELENFILRIGISLGGMRRQVRRLETTEMSEVKAFGSRLFGTLFDERIQPALVRSLDQARRRGMGLRIRLRLSDVPELTNVPWEYLYNVSANRFLSLSVDTPVVRYLDLPEPVRPLQVRPPINVLVMISSPADRAHLDSAGEWAKLNDNMADLVDDGLVSLTRLERATLADLQRHLRRGRYHVFHFIGHGGYDERTDEGVLLLEDVEGRSRTVSGQDLGMLLHDHKSLRLAVLNSCEGARSSPLDPFAGTAQSLVQQAIPAVIAMQFEITDHAAVVFSHELYSALADGYAVDSALSEARKAIFATGNDLEWATPVLYTRSPNGRIFRIARPEPAVTPATRRPDAEADVPAPVTPPPDQADVTPDIPAWQSTEPRTTAEPPEGDDLDTLPGHVVAPADAEPPSPPAEATGTGSPAAAEPAPEPDAADIGVPQPEETAPEPPVAEKDAEPDPEEPALEPVAAESAAAPVAIAEDVTGAAGAGAPTTSGETVGTPEPAEVALPGNGERRPPDRHKLGALMALVGALLTVIAPWWWIARMAYPVEIVLDLLLVAAAAAVVAATALAKPRGAAVGGALLGLGIYAVLSILDTAWFDATVIDTGAGPFALLILPLPLILGGRLLEMAADDRTSADLNRFWPWAVPGTCVVLFALSLPTASIDGSYWSLTEIADHFSGSRMALLFPWVAIATLMLVLPALARFTWPAGAVGAAAGLAAGLAAVSIVDVLAASSDGMGPLGDYVSLIGVALVLVGAWRAVHDLTSDDAEAADAG